MKQDLIYDIGLHKGEDTDFYLRKGFQVIGIEANPELVANAAIRFQDAIECGRLHIIHGAVAPRTAGETIVFYTNTEVSIWGTIKAEWAARNEQRGFPSKPTKVNRVDLAEVFRTYGVPFYLKVDIEGADHLVFEELKAVLHRPKYVSLETPMADFGESDFRQYKADVALLKSLGYVRFKIVQQNTIAGRRLRTHTIDGRPFEHVFDREASGPFGDDLPPPWLTCDEAIEQYRDILRHYKYFGDHTSVARLPKKVQKIAHKLYRMGTGYKGPLTGWFDTHASL